MMQDGYLTLFMFIGHNANGIHDIRQFMEVFSILTQIFPTSLVILFCIISFIIINQYINIGLQIDSTLHNCKTEFLNQFQSQYFSGESRRRIINLNLFLICIFSLIVGRSFDDLNECFGLILLFEITFNFIVVIMIIMSYIIKVQAVTWQSSCYLIGELIKNLFSLILICSLSENIRSKVCTNYSNSQ